MCVLVNNTYIVIYEIFIALSLAILGIESMLICPIKKIQIWFELKLESSSNLIDLCQAEFE